MEGNRDHSSWMDWFSLPLRRWEWPKHALKHMKKHKKPKKHSEIRQKTICNLGHRSFFALVNGKSKSKNQNSLIPTGIKPFFHWKQNKKREEKHKEIKQKTICNLGHRPFLALLGTQKRPVWASLSPPHFEMTRLRPNKMKWSAKSAPADKQTEAAKEKQTVISHIYSKKPGTQIGLTINTN